MILVPRKKTHKWYYAILYLAKYSKEEFKSSSKLT
jgi:hypothetical protein